MALPVQAQETPLFNAYGKGDYGSAGGPETVVEVRTLPRDDSAAFFNQFIGRRASNNLIDLYFSAAIRMGDNAIFAEGGNPFLTFGTCFLKLDDWGSVRGKLMMGGPTSVQIQRTDRNTMLLLGISGGTVEIVEADQDFRLLWRTWIGGGVEEEPNKLIPAPGSGHLLPATTGSYGLTQPGILLAHVDAAGRAQWIETLAGDQGLRAVDGVVTPDGGACVVANESAEGKRDIVVVRFAADGAVRWQQRVGASRDDEALCASAETGGGLRILLRSTSLRKDMEPELAMLAIDGSGKLTGQWYFQDSGAAFVTMARAVDDGGFIISASHPVREGGSWSELRSIDTEGEPRWSLKLQNVFDLVLLGTSSGTLLASAVYDDPSYLGGRYRPPAFLSLDAPAAAQRRDVAPLRRVRMSSMKTGPAELELADRPTTGLSARRVEGCQSMDYGR